MLEDAHSRSVGFDDLTRFQTPLAEGDHLAGVDLPDQLRPDDVEGTAFGGDHPVAVQFAEREWPDAERVTEGDDRVLGHDHGRVGTFELRHDVGDCVLDVPAVIDRDQSGDDLRVGGPPEAEALAPETVVEVDRVGQVAVVGEGQLTAVVAPDRLGVFPGATASGRVPHVADGHVAGKCPQLVFVKDLGYQAAVAHGGDVAALAGGNTGRFLSAVLKCVQAEVGESRDIVSGCVYAKDTAFITRSLAIQESLFAQGLNATCCR